MAGTATPTADQISDLRADIGDEDATTFTDDEIVRVWARVQGAANATEQHEASLAIMARQLMAQSAKFTTYRAGAVSENRSDVMKHLKMLYEMYKPSLEKAQGTNRQFAKSVLRAKPRQNRTEPGDNRDDGTRRLLP